MQKYFSKNFFQHLCKFLSKFLCDVFSLFLKNILFVVSYCLMEGVISFCSSAYGLILSEINLFNDNCYIVFGPYTNVSGIKIGDLGPLDEYFHAGVQVTTNLL